MLIGVSAIIIGTALWFSVWQTGDETLQKVMHDSVIRIGYSIEPPYAFPDVKGQVTGEAAETARAIVRRLGIQKIEWRQVEFGALLDGLQADFFDVVAASMYITRERAREAAFSEPSLRLTQGLLVNRGNPFKLHSYEDLAGHPRVRVAVLEGSVEERLMRLIGVPDARLIAVRTVRRGLAKVESGKAEALTLTAPAIRQLTEGSGSAKVEMAAPFRQPALAMQLRLAFCGFAFRHKDKGLRAAWNREQAAFIGSPEHLAILSRFGLGPENLPPPGISTKSVLEGK
ncbi:MAG: putative amino-acid ABC transporter-binding protein precursor [Syntrophorhabdus sp. PtaU1.Bin058]|nr:MAG: putative amino-acid ABC transporter-binding protein precursor [Syntrophorhabdus sp. PtaU1.Bin058]